MLLHYHFILLVFNLQLSFMLRQMIRLLTFTIGGRAYLNFMGNEFGHPKVRLLSQQYPLKF